MIAVYYACVSQYKTDSLILHHKYGFFNILACIIRYPPRRGIEPRSPA